MHQPDIVKVALLLVRGGKVLFVRSRGQKLFFCVGGTVEVSETLEDALVREVLEETAGKIRPETIRHFKTFEGIAGGTGKSAGKSLRIETFLAEVENEDEMRPSGEIEEFRMLSVDDKEFTTSTGGEILDATAGMEDTP